MSSEPKSKLKKTKILFKKNFHWFPFLFHLFFIFRSVRRFPGMIEGTTVLHYCLFFLLGSALIYILAKIITRRNFVAASYTFLFEIFFLFWSVYQEQFGIRPQEIKDHLNLIIILAIAIIFLGTWISNLIKTSWQVLLTKMLNILIFLSLIVEILFGTYTHATLPNEKNQFLASTSVSPQTAHLPDVYFLLFDAYASTALIQEKLGLDNSEIDTFLNHHQFQIQSKSKSNYSVTYYSLASTLNGIYYPQDSVNHTTIHDLHRCWKRI